MGLPTERMVRSADHLAEHFHGVPVIVVVCAHIPELAITDAGLHRPSVVGGASIYPAVQIRRKPLERVTFLDRWEQPLFPAS